MKKLKLQTLMKTRRILLVCLIIVMTAFLSGCDREVILYSDIYSSDEVTSIELIKYINNEYKDEAYNGEIEIDQLQVLGTLNTDEVDSFLQKLSKYETVGSKINDSSAPSGIGVKVTFSDMSFVLITINEEDNIFFSGRYSVDLQCESYVGVKFDEWTDTFVGLLNDYFESE